MPDKQEERLVLQQETISSPPEVAASSDLIGTIVDNHYNILSIIGVGGMGTVYEAEDILLHRPAAIKIMNRGLLNSSQSVMRFHREAKALGQLDHANIVRVTDFGVHEDVMPYMAMQFVSGLPLSTVLQRGPLSVQDTLRIGLQICSALEHAHQNNIVHRDLKPSNILVAEELNFEVKIIDFGIAAFADENQTRLTKTGEVFGSPLYMSPEQCSGQKADFRSDLYALGCILYECLTGIPPIVGETALVTMLKHQQDKPLSLKEATLGQDFHPHLEKIIAKTLEKSPERRYQGMAALRHDLQNFQSGGSVVAASGQPLTKTEAPSSSKFLWPAAALGALVLVALAGLIMYTSLTHQTREIPKVPEDIPIKFEFVPQLDHPQYKSTQFETIEKEQPEVLHCRNRGAFGFEDGLGDDQMSRISLITSIRCIDFTGIKRISGKGLSALQNMPHLLEIRLPGTPIRDSDLEHLNPGLKSLTLSSCSISDSGVKNLQGLAKLERLALADTKISDKSLAVLETLPKLQYLDLNGCDVHQDAVQKFLKARPLCVVVTSAIPLGDQPQANQPAVTFVSHESLQDLASTAKSHKIEALDLSNSQLRDSDAEVIARLPLRWLKINRCKNLTPAGINKILTNKTLLSISAVATSFNDDNCTHVNQNMQQLDIGVNHIHDQGVQKLSQLKRVTFVDLRRNPLSDKCLSYLVQMPCLSYANINGRDFDTYAVEKFKDEKKDCQLISH